MFTRKDYEEIREVRILYIMVELILAWIYGSILYSVPALRTPLHLTVFTLLFIVHGVLHWLSPYAITGGKRGIAYILIQGVLAFTIVVYGGSYSAAPALFSALIGEAVGLYRGLKRLLVSATLGYTGLAVLSAALVSAGKDLPMTLFILLPVILFAIIYPAVYGRQAAAKEKAETLVRELESAHRKLTEYSVKVEELTRMNERQRMARELHDTLAQGLAGLILQLEAVDSFLAENRVDRASGIVKRAMANARSALRESRNAIDNLRLTADAGTVEDRIRVELERLRPEGIRYACSFELSRRVPPGTTECIVRIVSEALTNIIAHARASEASLAVREEDGALRLEIRDDGRGVRNGTDSAGHYGILGMRERAHLAGGTFDIESAPGKGTAVLVRIPFPPEGRTA